MHRVKKNALFLVDGSYILYRSYYGLRPLKISSGLGVQAVYGFCRTIKRLMDIFDPQNFAVVWDVKGKTFRSEIYEAYKATRQAPPSDLFVQKEQIIKFLDLINLKQISKTGYEADDLIGSMAQDYKGEQVVIVGPDKDLYQLLSDKIIIYDPFKEEIIDKESFTKNKGMGPEKVPFFYSLLGDTSDNIPGVYGIGKKTALDLVNQFDSLDDLYKNLDNVKKDRTRNLLHENKDNAFLSLKLFLLKYYDLGLSEIDLVFDKNNYVNAANLFNELEFKSLLTELKRKFGQAEVEKRIYGYTKKIKSAGEVQLSLFGGAPKKTKEPAIQQSVDKNQVHEKGWDCHTVITKEQLEDLIDKLKQSDEIAIDTETTGIRPLKNELVGISFAFDNKNAYYIPLVHEDDSIEQLDRIECLELLKPVFQNKKIKKVLHNAKFDLLVFKQYDVDIINVTFDTLIAAGLLREEGDKINLKFLSAKYLGEPMNTFEQVLNKYKTFKQVPVSSASEYAAYDALQTFKLKNVLEPKLKKEKELYNIFIKLEMPLMFVLFDMELFGIKLDSRKLKKIGEEIKEDLKIVKQKILGQIEVAVGSKYLNINLNSPQQVQGLLFDGLKLPVVKKTFKGARGTGQEVLEALSNAHPIPGLILKYRELAKLLSTYVGSLINEINQRTGRVHTSFSQTMAATGRLSSSNPNLQNIPVTSEHGIKIRSAFVADKDKTFLAADYSQVELRVLAHMSNDKTLVKAFKADEDVHARTASQLFDVDIEDVTKEQRQVGKKINFSIIYGLTPFGLSKDLGIKLSVAKEYIDKYFETYNSVAAWINDTIEQAKHDGFVKTLMGRRRFVAGLKEKNKNLYNAAARIATNTPVQGTAAELIKKAMLAIDKRLKMGEFKSKIVLQIHDELVLEIALGELEKVQKIVENEMLSAEKWDVPLKVSVKTGDNWELVTK